MKTKKQYAYNVSEILRALAKERNPFLAGAVEQIAFHMKTTNEGPAITFWRWDVTIPELLGDRFRAGRGDPRRESDEVYVRRTAKRLISEAKRLGIKPSLCKGPFFDHDAPWEPLPLFTQER